LRPGKEGRKSELRVGGEKGTFWFIAEVASSLLKKKNISPEGEGWVVLRERRSKLWGEALGERIFTVSAHASFKRRRLTLRLDWRGWRSASERSDLGHHREKDFLFQNAGGLQTDADL